MNPPPPEGYARSFSLLYVVFLIVIAVLYVRAAGMREERRQIWDRGCATSDSCREAPVRIELTNSRFAVCRLTTWPRRRVTKLSGPEPPEQSGREDAERQSGSEYQHEHNHRENDRSDHAPLLTIARTARNEMTLQQRRVLHVRFPCCIEHVADGRNGTDQRIDADIHQHPRQCERWHLQARRLENDVARKHRADQIPNSRDQPNDRIKTDLPAGAWNRYGVVEQLRQHAHTLDPARGIFAEN